MRKIVSCLVWLCLGLQVIAQEKWDLKRSVDYALTNNISVKQADVQARLSELVLKQGRLSQFPNLNVGGNVGYSSGRNQDPTNFSLITTGYLSSGFSLQSGVDLFNWFSKRNTIAGNQLDAEASRAGVEKVRNDIALNVAAAYLHLSVLALMRQHPLHLQAVAPSDGQSVAA